jgi:Fe-S-cluster-containing dehydrogenase component
MSKWNLINDVALCTGCHNCTLSVQDEYVGNEFPGYAAEMPKHGADWVWLARRDRGTYPMIDVNYLFRACRHCDDPQCKKAAQNDAVIKRDDGIVIIHPERAKGQKAIADACPYGGARWNEEKQLAQHWNFDAHLIDTGWKVPRPVQTCPAGALRAVKVSDEEMQRMAEAEGLTHLPGDKHGSRLWYKNLHLYMSEFVGGTLLSEKNGIKDCIEGARVTLRRDKEKLGEAVTNVFGEFRFDKLPRDSGKYSVDIAAEHYRPQTTNFELKESFWLGTIVLDRN